MDWYAITRCSTLLWVTNGLVYLNLYGLLDSMDFYLSCMYPMSYIVHSMSYIVHSMSCILHSISCIVHSMSYIVHSTSYIVCRVSSVVPIRVLYVVIGCFHSALTYLLLGT